MRKARSNWLSGVVTWVLVALLCLSSSHAATINVPADQPTIQAGIDASVAWDTVLVYPGSYVEKLTYPTHPVIVKSKFGPDSTFILPSIVSVLVMTSGGVSTDSGSELSGFTFENITIIGQQPNGASINLIQIGGTFAGDAVGFFEIKENKFINCNVEEIIRGGQKARVRITRNLFKNCGPSFPIVVQESGCIVTNNTIDSCARGVIASGINSIVANNIVFSYSPWSSNSLQQTTGGL